MSTKNKVWDNNNPITDKEIEALLSEIPDDDAVEDADPGKEKAYMDMLSRNPMLARWDAESEDVNEVGGL